ncbi:MAG: ROK family protein [Pseudonocardiaceae bacterium]|nr:ROK family protein [Pseudonocardiaceae bacterium]
MLSTIRRSGPLSRAAIARLTSLSMPTVSRQVGALIELRLLHEVPDQVPNGAVGRPRVPVDINNDVIAACGVHIGVTTTTYGLTNLRGGLLGSERIATPGGSPEDALAHIAGRVRAFLRRWPRRNIIGIGAATGGQVDTARGVLEHDRLGWHTVPGRVLLERATGLPVHLDGHVPAMASAELLFGPGGEPESMLYFYARQVVGIALAVRGQLHRGPGHAGTIAHLAVGSEVRCPCGKTGCLEATVAEQGVVREAARDGVISKPDIRLLRAAAEAGEPGAVRLLVDRARMLGRAVGILRDIINPDLVVLGGQAITDAPDYLDELLDSFAATSTLPGTDLVEITRFGPDVQAIAACTGLLAQLYQYPLSVLAKANRGGTSPVH